VLRHPAALAHDLQTIATNAIQKDYARVDPLANEV
jgi:hypothetical protein